MESEAARTNAPPPTISPRTHRWTTQRRLGYGFLALLPGVLLVLSAIAAMGANAVGAAWTAAALLFYVHLASQLLVLFLFGHLMISNRQLSQAGKVLWGTYFLALAPAAIPSYWFVHVWNAEGREEIDVRVTELDPEPV